MGRHGTDRHHVCMKLHHYDNTVNTVASILELVPFFWKCNQLLRYQIFL